jgi:hypothetical protein
VRRARHRFEHRGMVPKPQKWPEFQPDFVIRHPQVPGSKGRPRFIREACAWRTIFSKARRGRLIVPLACVRGAHLAGERCRAAPSASLFRPCLRYHSFVVHTIETCRPFIVPPIRHRGEIVARAARSWALVAYGGIKALVAFIPDGAIPREAEIGLDVPVLLFSLGLAAATALLFGLAAALQMARRDIVTWLKDSARGVGGGFRRERLRNALVVVEVALSLVLLTGAGLMMRTFAALQQADLGFNPSNILVARLPFPHGQYQGAAEKQRFFSQFLPRLKGLPGVVEATETSTLPPYGGIPTAVEIPGKVHDDRWDAIYQLVSDGYFRTLGAKLARGRLLDEGEVSAARKVAVVNRTLAAKYFGHDDPIGRQIEIKQLSTVAKPPVAAPVFEIVGIIGDIKNRGIQDPVQPEILIPYTVTGNFSAAFWCAQRAVPCRC